MPRMTRCHVVPWLLMMACAHAAQAEPPPAAQGDPTERGDVVVSATQVPHNSFDLPVAIGRVDRERIQSGQAQVNLSESLGGVPGVVANNRQNYAQDLQVSSRGFGARSAFGIRGIQLFSDGIPATMPDGQGQAATFNLGSAERIEVLRGPFAYLYGNASGGVIQAFTEDGPDRGAMVRTSLLGGSYDTWRAGLVAGGQSGSVNSIVDASQFRTDGYREHSEARRDSINAKLKVAAGADTKVTLVLNDFDQPYAQDPLGLNATQVAQNPRQVDPVALQFNTRKDVRQGQGGVVLDQRLGGRDRLQLTTYGGQRDVLQYLALAGTGATSSGGVVDLERDYAGIRAFWTHEAGGKERPVTLTLGLDYGHMDDWRKGYVNNNGVAGDLRRDEEDVMNGRNVLLQGEWRVAPRWKLSAGVRQTRVTFDTHDAYITALNPDDSGSIAFDQSIPVVGVVFMVTPALNAYASVGKGFETPTFTELAYRNTGSGLNFDLKPSRSTQAEIGVKAFLGLRGRLDLALFRIDTEDEIVVDAASGGRTTYKNAPSTERRGAELALSGELGAGLTASLAYSVLDARFSDSYTSGSPAALVPSGNRLPGVPDEVLHGEVLWRHAPSGFSTALEAHLSSAVYANDLNTAEAGGYGVVNWRAGFAQHRGHLRFGEFLRIDNLFDRAYVGSVIVNDGNGRYYEPAPGRSWMLGVNVRYDT